MRDLDAPSGDDPTVQLSRGRMAAAQRGDPTTEVMSLDELMDLAASRPATSAPAKAAVADAYPAEPAPVAEARAATPPRAPMPVVPVRSEPALATGPTAATAAPQRTARQDLQRLREDAAKACRATIEQATTWLKAGDNTVIAATAAVAVLLIIMVAAL